MSCSKQGSGNWLEFGGRVGGGDKDVVWKFWMCPGCLGPGLSGGGIVPDLLGSPPRRGGELVGLR